MREGIRHSQPLERARHNAVSRFKTNSRRSVSHVTKRVIACALFEALFATFDLIKHSRVGASGQASPCLQPAERELAILTVSPCMKLTEPCYRIQGNPQGVEGEEEGRGECTKGGGGEAAPGSATPGSRYVSSPRSACPIRPATHDASSNGRSSTPANRVPSCRWPARRTVRSAAASRRRAAIRQQRPNVRRTGLLAEPIRSEWLALSTA